MNASPNCNHLVLHPAVLSASLPEARSREVHRDIKALLPSERFGFDPFFVDIKDSFL
jgi:hypothetical protein